MQNRKGQEQRYQKPLPKSVNRKASQTKQRGWLWLGLSLTGVAMVAATAGALLAVSLSSTPLLQQKLSPEEEAVFGNGEGFSSSNLRLPDVTRPVNVLMLGMSVLPSDLNYPGDSKNLGYEAQMHSVEGQSDTMLLMRFDPEKHKMAILSIPRDTRVFLGRYGWQKINDANVVGGPATAAKEVSKLLDGVAIDRYVRVNVMAVGKIVDALGGITIYVPKDMKYTDESQHLFVDLKQGRQRLNGNQTMQLLRFRHDLYGDLGRMQRQQMVIRAIMAEWLNPTTVAKIPQLLQVIKSDIDTNLSIEEILALVGFSAKLDRAKVQGLIVPGDYNGNGKHETSYWLPDRRKIRTMVAKYFDQGYALSEDVDPMKARISIQDSTDNSKAVQVLVKTLQNAGYRNVSVGAKLPEPLRLSKIVAEQGNDYSAQIIQQTLGIGEVRVETSGTLYSDVTIQIGQDWQPKLDISTPNSEPQSSDKNFTRRKSD